MNFDELTDRRGTFASKWDMVTRLYGVPEEGNLPMWVADTDFRVPDVALDAMRAMLDHGVLGYGYDRDGYAAAIDWWMQTRHGWHVDPGTIFTVTGLCNGVGLLLDCFTDPGDGVVLFTPVYHAFERVISAAGRNAVSGVMVEDQGRYTFDFEALQRQMTGRERMLILCSPHNPGGRVWTEDELNGVAEFARRNDLVLVSDEIHHDLVYPGHRHHSMSRIEGVEDRLAVLVAPSKTFNTAGLHIGQVIIPGARLRKPFAARLKALSLENSTLGAEMTKAVYSPAGADWVDALVSYLDGNRKLFDDGIAAIPGLRSMPLEATFLSWVDFANTGMDMAEVIDRVERVAGIAANHGATFGPGGETFLRFNIGTQRARIADATARLQDAFADLQ